MASSQVVQSRFELARRLSKSGRQPCRCLGVTVGSLVRPVGQQLSPDRGSQCLKDGGPRVVSATQVTEEGPEVVQRAGEVGSEGGVGVGQFPVDVDGFLGGGQGLGAPKTAPEGR